MKLEVAIEKSPDGLVAAYARSTVGRHGLAGYGDSVEEAIDDFLVSVSEMNGMRAQDGLPPLDIEIIPVYVTGELSPAPF